MVPKGVGEEKTCRVSPLSGGGQEVGRDSRLGVRGLARVSHRPPAKAFETKGWDWLAGTRSRPGLENLRKELKHTKVW